MKRTLIAAAIAAITVAAGVPAVAEEGFSRLLIAKTPAQREAIRSGSFFGMFSGNAHVSQQGSGNQAVLRQNGHGNVGSIHQIGGRNNASLDQYGNNNGFAIVQIGNGGNANVQQTGNQVGVLIQINN